MARYCSNQEPSGRWGQRTSYRYGWAIRLGFDLDLGSELVFWPVPNPFLPSLRPSSGSLSVDINSGSKRRGPSFAYEWLVPVKSVCCSSLLHQLGTTPSVNPPPSIRKPWVSRSGHLTPPQQSTTATGCNDECGAQQLFERPRRELIHNPGVLSRGSHCTNWADAKGRKRRKVEETTWTCGCSG